ncbi:MAG: aminodeoxychorismate synthase component I, partial [Elusimicrobia bacterium]|nr:aminodeoxychorismate synthase component I [Elusimicrobiota bacterium]
MRAIRPEDHCIFFETGRVDSHEFSSYYFVNPVGRLVLTHPSETDTFFSQLEHYTKKYYAAGFFSYELGYLLDDAFTAPHHSSFPYALFYLYDKPLVCDARGTDTRITICGKDEKKHTYAINDVRPSVSAEQYASDINTIKNHIKEGDIYQANYTFKYKFSFSGSSWALYQALKQKQNVSYHAYAQCGHYTLISLSPELFFSKQGSHIMVRPMKGTMKRGRTPIEDACQEHYLVNDEKNRSENAMIVDLMRNDLGRISVPGSVKVTGMMNIEKFDTLFQMTSRIESTLRHNLSIRELVSSMFPSGSVTGAPKIRSMEIIRKLEHENRGIYTGAIGFFEPNGRAKFNVAIRTVLIQGTKGEMGVGGGIVYDSRVDSEYAEAQLKARFFTEPGLSTFALIETIFYDQKYRNLHYHLDRMKASAEYFN